ncbi:MAG: TonB-dependent receptor [Bacteroidales bacterium]|nr:TonB-dependent receptor [Bacteroidales bacterium]
MKKIFISSIFIALFLTGNVQAQKRGMQGGKPQGEGTIEGKVIDKNTGDFVEYANIVLLKMNDSKMITGTVSDEKGVFKLFKVPFGFYKMTIDFIGYNKITIDSIKVTPRNQPVIIPDIYLKQSIRQLEGFEVIADKAAFEYKIDKKVVNVSQDINAAGGTAADVLENIPSVEIDIEGNVTLRGSGNFTVLINGRPSVLEGSDALQQLPSSSIENIEIITNPSAKYNPEGTAGIINVILKKEKENGLTGVFNASAGVNDKYRTDILLNYRTSKLNFVTGFNFRDDNYLMDRNTNRETYDADTTYFLESTSDRNMSRGGWSVKTGVDWNITKKTTIGLNGTLGSYGRSMGGETSSKEWTSPVTESYYNFSTNNTPRERNYYNTNLNFLHKFDKKGHKLEGYLYYSYRWADNSETNQEWETDEFWHIIDDPYKSIKTSEISKSDRIRVQLDYTKPIGEIGKFEAGFQSRFDNENEEYLFYEIDPNNGWVNNPLFSNEMDYSRTIHAAYGIYANELFGIGYQFGIRGEYTNRLTSLSSTNIDYSINRFDYFPSVHFSKQLNKTNQVIASYSKRINRPRGWSLDPFVSYIDENNRRVGNPDLKPEYIDAYELGWNKRLKKGFVSIEGYYRIKSDIISRVFEFNNEEGYVLHTFENLNKDYSLGSEVMFNFEPVKWLTFNLSGSIFNYRIKGELNGENIDRESTNWNTRLNSTFKFSQFTRLQFQAGYRSTSVTAQGSRKGNLSTNLALRHDFLKRKATVILQVRDLFGTMKRDFTVENDTFYEHSVMQRESQIVQLSFSYRINNYQIKKDKEGLQENGGDEEMYY